MRKNFEVKYLKSWNIEITSHSQKPHKLTFMCVTLTNFRDRQKVYAKHTKYTEAGRGATKLIQIHRFGPFISFCSASSS